MSRSLIACTVLCSVALATGCATTTGASTARTPAAPSSDRAIDQDHAYIQRVEQIAMRRGIGVTWVNPPTRRRARSTAD